MATDIRLHDLLSALWANPGRNRLDHNQLSFKPKVLLDSTFFHLLAADVTFSVIGHLFKKVRNCKLIVTVPNLLANDIDDSQLLSPVQI